MLSPKINKILPVLLAYIVMGFVDIVGVSTGYAQRDFNLSPELAQLIPSMVFIWFFILSIPVGILQNNLGKRKILLAGIFITAMGMFTPFVYYSYPSLLLCFLLLGIGNTIIQVSSNPLLQDVVHRSRFSSFMSLSQFIKALSSLVGPLLVTFMVASYGDWKFVFLIYGFISIVSGGWLALTSIEETKPSCKASFKTSIGLLRSPLVTSMVIAIFLIVGLDVGMNTSIQNLLIQKFNVGLERASLGISIYFLALMISRFLGALVLVKVDNLKFLFWTSLSTVFCIGLLIFASTSTLALILIFSIGLSSGNLFPLIFSLTIDRLPQRANEISGLMIMAVVGGAVIPPLMGLVNKAAGISLSFVVLLVCALYVFLSYYLFKKF
ncbi:sugar MFS transporter [Salegentibacter sp. Hel_I_6]|uniref:MFS transporter n=1 Tax=Salegentibacter sp. Hel_I_6 TaxID=1250278 RepID=UPI00055EBCFE|nr:MFS transporter [Salegentibacter sp. Hel_I_6]